MAMFLKNADWLDVSAYDFWICLFHLYIAVTTLELFRLEMNPEVTKSNHIKASLRIKKSKSQGKANVPKTVSERNICEIKYKSVKAENYKILYERQLFLG